MTAKLIPTVLLAAVVVFAQLMDPDEVREGWKPYTPPARPNTIRTQVSLVEIPVVVRDGNHTVSGLERADFQVADSGHPREVVSFSVESRTATASAASNAEPAHAPGAVPTPSPTPSSPSRRYIALLFDDLNINNADLAPVRAAANKYLKELLSAEDRVAVVTTASPKSTNFTSDMEDVSKQIDALRAHPHITENSGMNLDCPSLNFYEAYLIANNLDNELLSLKVQEYYDCTHTRAPPGAGKASPVQAKARALWTEAKFNSEATLRVVQELVSAMAPLEGRKAIVLTSSGFLTGELEPQLEEITHRAVRAGIVINSLEARGLWAPMGDIERLSPRRSARVATIAAGHEQQVQISGQTAPDDGLAALAYGTGGRFFENSNDLYAGYRDVAGVPDTLYVLGIATGEVQDGKYHTLKVRLTKAHHGSVQARPGYTASLPAAIPHAPGERPIDREFLEGGTQADVPVIIDAAPQVGTAQVNVNAHVDVGKLNFNKRDGRRKQSLTFIAALLDANGTFVTGKEWHVDLSLKESTYLLFTREAVNVTLALPASPGKYTIRGVVEESLTGKMSAASLPMEIH